MSDTRIKRRLRNSLINETVETWHRPEHGPGAPGGRTYDVLYAPSGRVRIDVSDQAGSEYRTLRLEASEIRPQQEWRDHLLATGQKPVLRRWCTVDGAEIPEDSDPEWDENCCSTECRNDLRPDW